jgi:hypothetical protein
MKWLDDRTYEVEGEPDEAPALRAMVARVRAQRAREPFDSAYRLTWRDSLPPRARPRYWWAVLTCNWFVLGLRCQIRGHERRAEGIKPGGYTIWACAQCGKFGGIQRLT